jgi:hypothetical protein
MKTRMDHEPSPVSPISVSAGLALLAYQGADLSRVDENQSSIKEDFALAIPEKDAFFLAQRRTVSLCCKIRELILSLVTFG